MSFSISVPTQDLRKAVAAVALAVPNRANRPVLESALIRVTDGGEVIVTGTDLDLSISSRLPETVDATGSAAVAVPAKKLLAILRESTSESTLIREDAGGSVTIRSDRSRYKLSTWSVDEFPKPGTVAQTRAVEIPAAAAEAAIRRTVYAGDSQSQRYTLDGISLEIDRGAQALDFVATDGRRLSWMRVGYESAALGEHETSPRVIIPLRAAKMLQTVLGSAQNARFVFGASAVEVQTESCVVRTRLLEGRFPRWSELVPKDDGESPQVTAVIAAGTLSAAVRQAAITADFEEKALTLELKDGSLNISSSLTEIGESRVSVPVAFDGGEKSVRVNHRYVSDLCGSLSPEIELKLSIASGKAPVLFHSDDGLLGIVMPMADA